MSNSKSPPLTETLSRFKTGARYERTDMVLLKHENINPDASGSSSASSSEACSFS